MDERERRAIEFEALAIEAQALVIEAMGMKYENEQQKILGQPMTYDQIFFDGKANALRGIADKLRAMKK